jgi:toxin ParE1/3/4
VRLVWRPRAVGDLVELRSYIAEENPIAAASVAMRIGQTVDRLRRFPEMGRPGRVPGTRELVIPGTSYIAAHAIARDEVVILAVIHAARRWPDRL